MKNLLCALALFSVLLGHAKAETSNYERDNFSFDVPEGWTDAAPPAGKHGNAQVSAVLRHEKTRRTVVVAIYEVPKGSRFIFADFIDGMRDKEGRRERQISEPWDETIEGIPFVFVTARELAHPPNVLTATTLTPGRAYAIQATVPEGSIEADTEIGGIVRSFRYLNPVPMITRAEADANSDGYRVGYKIGRMVRASLAYVLAGVAVILVVWFVRKRQAGQER